MKLKKDLFSDLLYGGIISFGIFIIAIHSQGGRSEEFLLNFVVVGLFTIWLNVLSSKFSQSIFIISKKKTSFFTIVRDAAKILYKSVYLKFAVLILFFSSHFFIRGSFSYNKLFVASMQLLSTSLYTIFIFAITQVLSKKVFFRIVYFSLLLTPIFLFVFWYLIFDVSKMEYLSLIPFNFHLIFSDGIIKNNTTLIILSSLSLLFTFIAFVISLAFLSKGGKAYNLPNERMN